MLEQKLQDQLSREILLSQRLRLVVVAGIMGICGVFLTLEFARAIWIRAEEFPPLVILPIILVMVVYQLVLRHYINGRLHQEIAVSSWVWYVHTGIEISVVTLAMVLMTDNFQNPMSVLVAPPALAYTILIVLSTLHLNFRMSLFAGGLAAFEFVCWAMVLIWTSETMADLEPIFRITFVYVIKALLLFLCGVGAAFVARELRRRMLNALQATEARDKEEAANEAKSNFLANMSHEIRTPLNAILGYAQLMDVDSNLTLQQRQAMQTIGSSGNHLLNLINDVLDLSKIESGQEMLQTEDFDLAELALGVGTMFQLRCEQKGLEWAVLVDSPPLWVQGDEGKLRQVLVNLLGNAVKFTDHGRVALTIKEIKHEEAIGTGSGELVLETLRRDERQFLFEVLDTGPGIPSERQAAIFDPFQQEESGYRKGGTGLGLAIAYRHVALMGGALRVDSTVGIETRFSFDLSLPVAQGHNKTEVETLGRVKHLTSECRVRALVVDDVEENRAVMKQILERVGVTVLLAESGEKALALVEAEVPDIVFMDIQMPNMSGEKVMQKLFDIYGRDAMKMVAVSASVLSHQRQFYLDAGFEDFIDKPVHLDRIYGCLSELLGVTFDSEDDGTVDAGVEIDLNDVVIDEAVWVGLKEAADNHSITDLRQRITALESMGDAERHIAVQLQALAQQFDMAGILKILDEVGHE
ncbi:MAG: response regulator [Candidatus Latescibacteria bacterium]|nr:response regulator [Candidatus Latescibacterota bacterium]MBT4139461.1 response regulator [Candidatus Latescibacterota bacterium]MBT5830722.1 response regulator [Candidatus Latescibacterota bacterium]